MKPGEKNPLLCRATTHIDDRVEKVSATLAALEGFANQLVVVGQVGAAVDTRVGPVAIWKIGTECLHASRLLPGHQGALSGCRGLLPDKGRQMRLVTSPLPRCTRSSAVLFTKPSGLKEEAAWDDVARHQLGCYGWPGGGLGLMKQLIPAQPDPSLDRQLGKPVLGASHLILLRCLESPQNLGCFWRVCGAGITLWRRITQHELKRGRESSLASSQAR